MAKEEIVAGLQRGLAKGQSLEAAMMSFYNAGYLKEDIEDAARFLQNPQLQQSSSPMSSVTQPVTQPQQTTQQPQTVQPQQTQVQTQPVTQPQQTTQQPSTTQQPKQMPWQQKQPIQSLPGQQPIATVQKVSAYGKKPSSLWTAITFILIFFLLALIGALIAIFLFREEIINFLNEVFLPLIKIRS